MSGFLGLSEVWLKARLPMAFLLFVVGILELFPVQILQRLIRCKFFCYGNTENKLAAYFRETCKSLLTNVWNCQELNFKNKQWYNLKRQLSDMSCFLRKPGWNQSFFHSASTLQFQIPTSHPSSRTSKSQNSIFNFPSKSSLGHPIDSRNQWFTLNTH